MVNSAFMWGPPTETQAIRREFGFAFLAFVIGSILITIGIIYLHVRYGTREETWWDLAQFILMLLVLPVYAGIGCACVTIVLLGRWHHYLGVYRCCRCGRPLPHRGNCICVPEEFRRVRRPRMKWRHYRRQIGPALALYAAFVPIAFGVALVFQHTNMHRFLVAFVAAHWAICMTVFIAIDLYADTSFGRNKRFRKRWAVFKPVFGAYPLTFALGAAAVGIIRSSLA